MLAFPARSSSLLALLVCASATAVYGCADTDGDDGGGGRSGAGTGGSAGKGGSSGTGGSAGKGGSSGKGGSGGSSGKSGAAGEGGTAGEGGAGESGAAGEAGASGNGGSSSGGEGGGTSGEGGTPSVAGAGGSGDGAAPVISLIGDAEIVLDCGATYVEPGVSAADAEDGSVDVTSTGVESIVTTEPGRFVVSYAAVDSDGNDAAASRVVNVCGPACGALGKDPIDLTDWTAIQYEQASQGDASWTLSSEGFAVTQTVNGDASILLSSFDATDLSIEGVWRMNGSSDDDFVGFVFGYQDPSHFYLFDWKGASQTYMGSYAAVGMSLKAVSFDTPLPLESDKYTVDVSEFWASEGTANVRILAQNDVPLRNDLAWDFAEDYHFFLEFHPGSFRIRIENSTGVVLEDWSVADTTYTDGGFGFYNFSQAPVVYSSFTQRVTPPACSTVGED